MDAISAIRSAGHQGVLISFVYDGEQRTAEPYSLKEKGGHLLFYGWCLLRNEIRSFDPAKMSSAVVTTVPYSPRFPVEF